MYHNRLNPNKTTTGNKNVIQYLKNIICSDSDTFTDYHQFRQPVLKIKKNLNQNANKLKDFINKINSIQNSYLTNNYQCEGIESVKRMQCNNPIERSSVGEEVPERFFGLKSSKGKNGINLGSAYNRQ